MHILKLFTSTSINFLKLRKIPHFQYTQTQTQPRYQSRKARQAKQGEQELRQYQSYTIDPSYWQRLLPTIQAPAAKVVKILINPNSSRKQISRQVQAYLEFRNFTFTQNVRTDLGCVSVLIALNQSRNSQNNEQYENRIIDFITLSDTKNSPYDSVMLRYIIMGINKRIGTNVQKNIKQYYRMKLVEIVQDNFERLDNKDLLLLAMVVQESIDKDKMNFITKWRLYPLALSIFGRVIQLMQTYLSSTQHQIKKSIDIILTPYFYVLVLRLIFYYGYISPEHAQVILRFETARGNDIYSDQKLAVNFFNVLCYIPYTEMTDEDGSKTTFKKMMLKHFEKQYNQSPLYRRLWGEFSVLTRKFTFQRIFQEEFHAVFKSLPFQKAHDKYLLLKKQHLRLPQIPQFVWRLFNEHQRFYLDKMISNHTIKALYPERVTMKKQDIPDFSQRSLHSFSDNEINLKIWQALAKLGYEFKKEQICSDRQVDLLIEGNIILEVDGQGHYMFLTSELSSQTTYRNLHLLLSGYKLMIISMFEYNLHRQPEALEKLVKEKIQYLKNQDYVYIC